MAENINWSAEVVALAAHQKEQETQYAFWKAPAGQHTVRFLSEGYAFRTAAFGDRDKPKDEQVMVDKVLFHIRVGSEDFSWAVTKGKGLTSLYGQIALFASAHGGLTGKDITLLVKGQAKDKDYTIMESLELMKLQRKPSEEQVA